MRYKSLKSLKVGGDEEGTVQAVFATLNVRDSDGDVTRPGAFRSGEKVRISAYNHASWGTAMPVGKGTIAEVGDEAILDGQFFMDTAGGRETFAVVKALGELMEWSYGYDVLKASDGEQDGEPVRFLESVKVYEVSPVILGAGVNTRTLAAKRGSGNLRLTEHIASVMADVDEVSDRIAEVLTTRAAQGKSLGGDSRELLELLATKATRLQELLDRAAPATSTTDRLTDADYLASMRVLNATL